MIAAPEKLTLDADAIPEYQAAVQADPVGWIYEALGVELWGRQAEIAEAVRDYPRVAVRSCNASGKTMLASCLVPWFLQWNCPGYAMTTAGAWRGVKRGLWPQLRRTYRQAPYDLGGRMLQTEWQLADEWAAFGVTADDPENISGFRTERGIYVTIDEASIISKEIMEAVDGLCASGDSKILMIGNPLRPSGPFYEAFRNPAWKSFHISAFDTPNVQTGREIIPGLITSEWVERVRQAYGEQSAFYRVRVLGEFPEEGENTLIALAWVEVARQSDISTDITGTLRMGVDVARYGSDLSVTVIRDDVAVRHMLHWAHCSTMETVGRIHAVAQEYGIQPADIRIDDCGVGGGVTDRLREQGWDVVGVNNGARAENPERFVNVRAESYWRMREALNPEGDAPLQIASGEEFDALAAELVQPRFSFTSRGQIKIEEKDAIRSRLGHSPDCSDALALTYAGTTPIEDFVVA